MKLDRKTDGWLFFMLNNALFMYINTNKMVRD